jgi:hypothetical protein
VGMGRLLWSSVRRCRCAAGRRWLTSTACRSPTQQARPPQQAVGTLDSRWIARDLRRSRRQPRFRVGGNRPTGLARAARSRPSSDTAASRCSELLRRSAPARLLVGGGRIPGAMRGLALAGGSRAESGDSGTDAQAFRGCIRAGDRPLGDWLDERQPAGSRDDLQCVHPRAHDLLDDQPIPAGPPPNR